MAGELLITTYTDGESDLVVALDAGSGDERWRYTISAMTPGHDVAPLE